MPWYGWYLSGLLSASLWLLALLLLLDGGLRRLRRGFTATGRASGRGNPAMVARVRTYTGCSTAGGWPVDVAGPVTHRAASKTSARIGSGFAIGGSRGADKPQADAPDDPRVPWALAEARQMLAEGYLFPGDYVTLMDDPESDEGKQIAHVDADGNLVERAAP